MGTKENIKSDIKKDFISSISGDNVIGSSNDVASLTQSTSSNVEPEIYKEEVQNMKQANVFWEENLDGFRSSLNRNTIQITDYTGLVVNNEWTSAFRQAKIDAGVNGKIYVSGGEYIINTIDLDIEGQEWYFDSNALVKLKDDSIYWFNACNILFNIKASSVKIKGLHANGNMFRQNTSSNRVGSTTSGSDIIKVDNITGLWSGVWIKIDGIDEMLRVKNVDVTNKQIQVHKNLTTTLLNQTIRIVRQVKGIFISKLTTGRVSDVIISDFYLDGCGIHGVQCDDVTVYDGYVKNTFDTAIQFSGRYTASDWYNSNECCNRIIINNVNLCNHHWAGVFFQMCHNSICSNSVAVNCEDMGFDFEYNADSIFIGCTAEKCQNGFTMMNPNIRCSVIGCIAKDSIGHGIRLVNGLKELLVSNCQSIRSSGYGVELENYSDSIFSNCIVTENMLGGIYMGNSHRSIISNVIIKDNKHHGIFLISSTGNYYESLTVTNNEENGINVTANGASYFKNNVFSNCNIKNNAGIGLLLPAQEAMDCDIIGCKFSNHQNKAALEMNFAQRITIKSCIFTDNLYGIYSSQKINYSVISNNRFHGNTLHISCAADTVKIADNEFYLGSIGIGVSCLGNDDVSARNEIRNNKFYSVPIKYKISGLHDFVHIEYMSKSPIEWAIKATYYKGMEIINKDISPGKPRSWVCTKTGTIGTLVSRTCNTILSSNQVVCSDVTGLSVGDYILIKNQWNDVGYITAIDTNTKTITLSRNCTSNWNNAVIIYDAPIFIISGQYTYRTNNGTPIGAVTPYFIGEELLDSTNKKWYKAIGATNTDWV